MKKVLLILTFTIFSFLNTSCFDAIYQGVRNEVVLEDSIINGFLNSIVRYADNDGKEWLYLQNGLIYRKMISDDNGGLTKNASHDRWDKVGQPGGGISYDYFGQDFDGLYACKLATDDKYIYMLGATPWYDEDHGRNVLKNFKLYYSEGKDWKTVDSINEYLRAYTGDDKGNFGKLDDDNYMMDASIQLFCTNAPKKEHRKAFIRIGGGHPDEPEYSNKQEYASNEADIPINCGIFELNGQASTFISEGTGKIDDLKDLSESANGKPYFSLGASKDTLSCVWFDGEVKFFDYIASCTDETKDKEPTIVYFAKDSSLYYYKEGVFETGEKQFESVVVDGGSSLLITSTDEKAISDVRIGSTADNILSIAVTGDSVLLGTDEEGIYRAIDETKDGEKTGKMTVTTSFKSNARDQMDDPYIIRVLLCTDPSINEMGNGSAIYSSKQFRYTQSNAAAVYRDVGLWAYYSGKGNWNRE